MGDELEECRDRWELIFSKMESAAATECLQTEFKREDKLIKPDPGHIAARRLNRAEYNKTVRESASHVLPALRRAVNFFINYNDQLRRGLNGSNADW